MRQRLLAIAALSLLTSGCGSVLDRLFPNRPGPQTGAARLIRFASEREMNDYFSRQIAERNSSLQTIQIARLELADAPPTAAPIPNGETAADADNAFSQTTIQEPGVDEADVVKTDGTHLYIINRNGLSIVDVSDPDSLTVVGRVAFDGFGGEIYLHDDKVVALTRTPGGFIFVADGERDEPAEDGAIGNAVDRMTDNAAAPEFRYERPSTTVTIIDVSDPAQPAVLTRTRFDGSPVSSRMIDGILHLVLTNHQHDYYDVLPLLGSPNLDVQSIDNSQILPTFEQRDDNGDIQSGPAVTWRDLYRPDDPDGFGVVTVVSLDVDRDGEFSTVGVVAEPGLVYSSLHALYLTDTAFDFSGSMRESTDIYKLRYRATGAEPVAAGTVPGRILNQFSMGEFDGHLRVATTVGPFFAFPFRQDAPFNNVYVLRESDDELQVVSRVENIAPGETIQSARFVGDRGFLVTFEQIDPLFTLDLSDPAQPRVVGELKVPGFSTFIVPMDDDHLLTIGRHVPETFPFFPFGVQISIFDVSDFARPELKHNVIFGDETGAWSEALFNPKAFTWFPERGLAALPLSMFGGPIVIMTPEPGDTDMTLSDDESDVQDEPFDGLIVFQVSAQDGIDELGRISTRFPQTDFHGSMFTRGVFAGPNVFAVTDRGLRGGPVSELPEPAVELLLSEPPVRDGP